MFLISRSIFPLFSSCRLFHATSFARQRLDHPLFPQVNWEKVSAGYYAVVDPFAPSHIRYYSEKQYDKMSAVMISNSETLVVLAEAGSKSPSKVPDSTSSTDSKKSSPARGRKMTPEEKKRAALLLANFLIPEEVRQKKDWGPLWRWKSWFARFGKPVQDSSIRLLLSIHERNLVIILRRWGYALCTLGGIKMTIPIRRDLVEFTVHLLLILRSEGLHRMLLRMKIYLFCVYQFIAGNKLTCTHFLGIKVALTHGLPRALPLRVRHHIRQGHADHIRMWVSLLNSYRAVIDYPSKYSLGFINEPPAQIQSQDLTDFSNFVEKFWLTWSARNPDLVKPRVTPQAPMFLNTAGPNGKPSVLRAEMDAWAWVCSGAILNLFAYWHSVKVDEKYVEMFLVSVSRVISNEGIDAFVGDRAFVNWSGDMVIKTGPVTVSHCAPDGKSFSLDVEPTTLDTFTKYSWAVSWLRTLWKDFRTKGSLSKSGQQLWSVFSFVFRDPQILNPKPGSVSTLALGRLSLKYGEPVQKVRWFAIVDYWSQSSLLPLHNYLFDVLRTFPADGTFDHGLCAKRLGTFGPRYWCFDLKAATDLIPIQLYHVVLSRFVDPLQATAWVRLLTGRPFVLKQGSTPKTMWKYHTGDHDSSRILDVGIYGRGQPMGALSSWAMLALVHHLVILFAAYRVLGTVFEFSSYGVVGDDGVIAQNEEVAKEYNTVCEKLSVARSPAKDYVSSNGFFHFVERAFMKCGVEISPMSLREEVNVNTLQDRLMFLNRALDRSYFTLGGNALTSLVSRAVSPPISETLRSNHFVRGLVDDASRQVAPLILHPRSLFKTHFRAERPTVLDWIRALPFQADAVAQFFYRGVLAGSASMRDAGWTRSDLTNLHSQIQLNVDSAVSRLNATLKNLKSTYDVYIDPVLAGHTRYPTFVLLWLGKLATAHESYLASGNATFNNIMLIHELLAFNLKIYPGSKGLGLPLEGVPAATSLLNAVFDAVDEQTPSADLANQVGKVKPKDRYVRELHKLWTVLGRAPASRGPPFPGVGKDLDLF